MVGIIWSSIGPLNKDQHNHGVDRRTLGGMVVDTRNKPGNCKDGSEGKGAIVQRPA